MNLIFMLLLVTTCTFAETVYYYQNGKVVTLHVVESKKASVRNADAGQQSVNYFQNDRGVILGASDNILIKFLDLSTRERLSEDFDLQLIKKLSEKLYLFKVKDQKKLFETVNALYQRPEIEYAHPDFSRKVVPR